MKSHSSLQDRFEAFLNQLEEAESIDDTLSNTELAHGKRADYLLDHRRFILEVKALETDPKYKVEKLLKPHRDRPEFPLFFWDSDLSEILQYLPDGEEIRQEIVHSVMRSVQGALEKADDQISETKVALELPDACGVVVILNQGIDILSPELVTAKASQMLLKTKEGDTRYKQISYVWIISESHRVSRVDGLEQLPLIVLEGPSADNYPASGEYLDSLQSKWAEYEGRPFFSLGQRTNFDGLSFEKRKKDRLATEDRPLVRHEVWRHAYRQNPYLRSLSEKDFLEHIARITSYLDSHFLVGGRKLSDTAAAGFMEGWTHALEEAEYRRLNMKKLK